MYSSRGGNSYGQQQPYSSQSSYAAQNLGAGNILGGRSQESEFTGLRAHGHVHGHPSAAAAAASPQPHYGGQYNSVYGSAAQQISPMGKASAATALEGRSNYGSSIPDSPKFSTDYVPSSSRGYGQKVGQLYSDRISEYPSIERRQYADRHSGYLGTDLPSEAVGRYVDPVSFGHEHQSKMYDHMEQVLKAHALQSASVEGGARQADYLAARSNVRHPGQDPIAYGGRTDPEPHPLSMISGSSYGGQQTASILGAAPLRTVDDLIYAQSSSNPGYGVSLPPGRDYGSGKGLHRLPLESDYPTSTLARASHLRVDDRKDDRITYGRELEGRDDRAFLREREDREREKERLRERERERQRERERDKREREREREKREREKRERERRDKEKEREHKRGLDLKRELTPPRASRDRRGPSLTKDIRSQRRESPRREVSNRPHSPVKEKRREYSCKVFSFSFVEAERDYLSLDKRYPRLYVSPECSKVLVYWPKKDVKLSLYTPVSFEHDFVEEGVAEEKKGSPSTQLTTDMSREGQPIIWNAKIILMSGLSQNALAELSSERTYGDRIPHFCNTLRFAVLKKNSSLMAIGGPWDIVDGGDPSVDDSSLIRTALRHAKDVTNLDLKNCRHWNRFLEIHYDRVGKDGLFSHKEVTVLYVPDLSECLPSLDSWRDQWINHKKTVSERERQQNLKKETPGHKDEVAKDKKKPEPVKASTQKVVLQKKKEPSSSGHADDNNKDKDSPKLKDKEKVVALAGKGKDKPVETKDVGSTEEEKNSVKKDQVGSSSAQEETSAKTGKKKIIKRIVKKKVAIKKDITEDAAKLKDVQDKDDAGGNNIISEVDGQKDGSSPNPPTMKTFVRKKIVKKSVQPVQEKDEQAVPEAKEAEIAEDKAKVTSEEATNELVQESGAKTTVKKKIIKRVPKRKAVTSDANNKVAEDDTTAAEKVIQPEEIKTEGNEEADKSHLNKVIAKDINTPQVKAETVSVEKQDIKEEAKGDSKDLSSSATETSSLDHKVSQTDNAAGSNEKQDLKEEKERKNNDVKNESKIKANKVEKEKRKIDEPPRHPGFLLQTKGRKDSKLQSLSLSLDSLLDYSDKDIEDSNFELSLFAESMYEMLQYKMGGRLLAFLQKLRVRFVSKRNQSKRPRQETSKKENEDGSSKKRAKINEDGDDIKSTKAEKKDDVHHDDNKVSKEEANATKQVDDAKVEEKNDEDKIEEDKIDEDKVEEDKIDEDKIDEDNIDEEEPEEDPEEDEEMQDVDNDHDSTKEENPKEEKKEKEKEKDAVGDGAPNEQNGKQETAEQIKETLTNPDPSNKDKVAKVESETKGTTGVIDKKLLQAFRFFDRNRAGYIRVEDLRLIIHNLGNFLSHRDVKELVQSALLESNTGRDDRILYEKLVKMSVI